MSTTDRIIHIISQQAIVEEAYGPDVLDRGNPMVVRPIVDGDDNTPQIKCWTYRRYNGATVLRLEADTDARPQMPVMDLNRWVAQRTGEMPFATVRLIESENRTVKFAITHSMVAKDVTENSIREVFDGMFFMWRKATDKLKETEMIGEEGDFDFEEIDTPVFDPSDLSTPKEDQEPIAPDMDRLEVPEDLSVNQILSQLNEMIGLEPVKQLVAQLAAQQMVAKQRAERGLKAVVPSPHLVFLGNPGTGKTTVARLIGKLYKALGLLSSGHVIEADRSSLVAAYLGQTAIKTKEVCEQALNGVLFVDEAYSLAVDGRDYGQEAIEALLTFMESHRNEFVLVVAGYPDKMQNFMNSNPGLRSRFDVAVDFPDYSNTELDLIFHDLAKSHDYRITPDAATKISLVIESWVRDEGFGNARQVRRFFNIVAANHATKMAMMTDVSTEDLQTITDDVVPGLPTAPVAAGAGPVFNMNGYL